uniref:NS factory n=1 Tax=Avian orthoreovirus TaxID=38170 RepID=A0A385JBE6_9REOV|nr:NS factory [Avian orthoreovirus]
MMASTKWGDNPVSLSMSHDSSSVRSSVNQFMNVPVSRSSPIASHRRTVLLKFTADDDLVTVQGPLAPFDEYWYEHQSLLSSAVAFLADSKNFKNFEHHEKFQVKKGHQISEIMNRLRLFFTEALKLKMSPESLPSLGQFLVSHSIDDVSATHVPDATIPVIDKIIGGEQTVSQSPGRIDEEVYNTVRSRFLTHTVHDLASDTPGVSPFLEHYYETVPTANSVGWQQYRRIGLLITEPNESLEDLTIFRVSAVGDGYVELSAGEVVVAKFKVETIDRVAPEHHKSVQKDTTCGTSWYSSLTATAHDVVFFTPNALRWAIDRGCTDSLVSPRHIRVCVGFDPLVARWTGDGVTEASYLMDDKLESVGKSRMVMRTLALTRRSPINDTVVSMLRARGGELIDHYRYDAPDRYGSVSTPVTKECENCSVVEAKLRDMASRPQVTSPIPMAGNAALLSKIADLQRVNRELSLKLADHQRPSTDHLLPYLENHVCVNAKDFERELLAKMNLSTDTLDKLMTLRARNRDRFELRLKNEAEQVWEPRLIALNQELDGMRADQQAILDQSLAYLNERDALALRVDELEKELSDLRTMNLKLNADNHRISRATRVGNVFVSDTEPVHPDRTASPALSIDSLVDEL